MAMRCAARYCGTGDWPVHRKGNMITRLICTALVVGMAFSVAACSTTLTPFDEILAGQPNPQFVKVGDQWVHFERKGQGESLVLIHGFGGSSFMYRKVIDGLAGSFDVIAVDLNGFGFTERPRDPAAYSPRGQVALVTGLMDRLGVQEAHVAGHSYGAGIALLMAAEQRRRVGSLIVVDGGAPREGSAGTSPLVVPLLAKFLETFVITEENFRRLLENSVYKPQTVTDEMVRGYYERLRVDGLTDALRGFLAETPVLDFDFGAVKAPALIIWGEHDRIIPIAVGEALHERLKGSMFVKFDRSAHLPMEEEPEKFVEVIEQFLKP